MVNKDAVETEELNKKVEEVQKTEDAAAVIKHYEDIIRTKKKDIIPIAYHNIIFKINIFKLIRKYAKLMKSSTGLGFLKNYYKDTKKICEENSKEFK